MTVNVCLGLHLERPLSILVCLQLAGISENFHKQLANLLPLTCIIQILPTINNKTKKTQGLLTSCANILYSSSLVTEILSLSVLSTTTITNFKKLKVSQRTNSIFLATHLSAELITVPITLSRQSAGLSDTTLFQTHFSQPERDYP